MKRHKLLRLLLEFFWQELDVFPPGKVLESAQEYLSVTKGDGSASFARDKTC